MKDRSDDPSHHERTLLPRSYISLVKLVGPEFIVTDINVKPVYRLSILLGQTARWLKVSVFRTPCLNILYIKINKVITKLKVVFLNHLLFVLHGRASAYGAMSRMIDSSWLTHSPISLSGQYSMTGIAKAVVCAILSVG